LDVLVGVLRRAQNEAIYAEIAIFRLHEVIDGPNCETVSLPEAAGWCSVVRDVSLDLSPVRRAGLNCSAGGDFGVRAVAGCPAVAPAGGVPRAPGIAPSVSQG
jgi:hypothetical protein